ncbi:hypothetical protein [Leptolyngbya sp. FACHB-17]|uniref:gasdermin n=1 Tax=unclassified Leptolyngbya TaxID=2650499 RepID=UPI001681283C|nr:hypothetical protein [Leptolyngbya sp. FACHB-17]MBD2080622.1 hypothetical protein [Leptolyngbya sp. FACHB-17]
MAASTDQAVDHLNQLGYNALKLPRQNIAPLMVLSRDPQTSICSLFGHISDIVEDPSVPLPKIWENLHAGTISGMRTNRLEFKFGLSILNTLLSAIGAKSAGFESAFGNASTLEFEYENAVLDNVMPASVSAYLRRATPFIDESLIPHFDAPGEAFIIIDVLKSNSFGIRAYRDDGGGIDLNLNAVKEIVGISAKFAIEKKADLKISFKGEEPLGFGFKACPIWVDTVDGKSRFRLDPSTNQAINFRGATEATAEVEEELTPMLIAPNELMELD